jgi:C1A family cysteine protease
MKKNYAIFFVCLILLSVTFRHASGWVLSNHPGHSVNHHMGMEQYKPPPSIEEIRRKIREQGFYFTVDETRMYNPPPGHSVKLPGSFPCSIEERRLKRPYPVQHLPSYFDWRDEDKITPVKDQYPCQLCWAFTAAAELESKILLREDVPYDLSEQGLASCDFIASAGKARSCSTGGSAFRAINYLTQRGAALESCQPFLAIDGVSCDHRCEIIKNVDGWRVLPNLVEAIKAALYRHGPVASSMDASDPAFRAYTGGVYEYYDSLMVNHSVLIVGWDDNLGPAGAWIVKNSWGDDWGMNGYCYIAYGAAKIGTMSSFISSYKDSDPDESILYYDEGGFFCLDAGGSCEEVNSIGAGRPTAWCAAVFTPETAGTLRAVDFWTTSVNAIYEIRVYDRMQGSSMRNLRSVKRGRCDELGYYSIKLSRPIPLRGGDDFVVAIRLTTPGYGYPIPVDVTGPPESERCYVSEDGKAWQAIGRGTTMPYDLAVRARVVGVAGHD